MFFKFLKEIEDERIYSIAEVANQKNHNLYHVRDNDVYFTIYTHEKLNIGEWIRFIGTLQSEVITLEFIEILHNTDVRLIKKCIFLLKEN